MDIRVSLKLTAIEREWLSRMRARQCYRRRIDALDAQY